MFSDEVNTVVFNYLRRTRIIGIIYVRRGFVTGSIGWWYIIMRSSTGKIKKIALNLELEKNY